MATRTRLLTIGTRSSALARWQTNEVIRQLQSAWPELDCRTQLITTSGDRILDKPLPEIGGKGLFTEELENALRSGEIDLAVHSLKDLPVDDAPGPTQFVVWNSKKHCGVCRTWTKTSVIRSSS